MRRCTFYVPTPSINVVCVEAENEAVAREMLERNEGVEFLYSLTGTTKSGGIELIACLEIAPNQHKEDKV